ncbi:hypothetical protein HYN59_09915 [Flavobacterium album]|uniref:DUF433 domain-containing protein n=1 Tax=Flavobacterium album TaxID=2175091 RepID=A0A2S1QYU5_9FLAO|nr:DUF433 domain-containing protein [Flavobacterium album]AWH85411.1 hypothetical protein HYN59_09915 [Flavobacterium album]
MVESRYIELNQNVRFGKPIITGTRITVEDVLNWLESGMTIRDILNDFPELNAEQVNACIDCNR